MTITVGKHKGIWKADPPHAAVGRGTDVTWSFGPCKKWTLSLPKNVFEGDLERQGEGPDTVSAKVKNAVPNNPEPPPPKHNPREYRYQGTVKEHDNDKGSDIEGDSPPTVIIDP
ncbi:MAG: hypothetical protein ACXVY9_07170 [Terriglobales bacterium]